MAHLSTSDISDLIERVGSHAHVATAAWSLGTDSENVHATPNDWASGRFTPSEDQMERLVVLREVMVKVAASRGRMAARSWLLGNDDMTGRTPLESVRRGLYDDARDAAERA